MAEGLGFNPTMVRLLPTAGQQTASLPGQFQSHNGAIAAFPLQRPFKSQSQVSIPQWCDCCLWRVVNDFNDEPKFQSHNGAIAARFGLPECGLLCRFQSHNGAIAARPKGTDEVFAGGFNPTMVRLLQ